METLEQKKRRLFGKQYLDLYKKELSKLVNSEISNFEFISLIETDKLQIKGEDVNIITNRYDFNYKSVFLKVLLNFFLEHKFNKYYLLTSYYKDCGAIILESLNDFNIEFKFDDEHTGIIEIIDSDLENKILLDYYEEGDNRKIDIEIHGSCWVEIINQIYKKNGK